MLTLLTEIRYWTAREDVVIKDTDFGAFRYQEKKESHHINALAEGKRNYAEKCHGKYILDNKRPEKLRQSIKKLEDYMKHHRIVYCRWRDHAVCQLLLSNGVLVHICISPSTGTIIKMAFDKYFVGKLISDSITDAVITRQHILIAYNQNQLTFVYLQRPNMKRMAPEKIARMDPKVFNVIINGPPQTRALARQLACNNSFDLVAVWTKSSQNEVYPWRPTVRDQDRANVHIYKLSRLKLESMCYYWTENDPISVEFSRTNQNQLHSVEQKISRKGEVTIEICIYEIKKSRLHRIATTAIPLQSQVCCTSLSPDNEKLMLGCIDGSVVIFDESRGITHLVKAAFIPTLVSWHCDSAVLMIANERCQFQCFDISLACIKTQPITEDMTPTNLLDLSGYFVAQPALLGINWSKKPDLATHSDAFAQTDCFLLLHFDAGPLAALRFFGGAGLRGDVHTAGFTADVLIHKYLNLSHVERAINLLLCMNWDTYGAMCLNGLHKIAAFIFRRPLTVEREVQLQKALGSFLVPVKRLCVQTETEFGDQVRDVTRKFFQHLLRYKSYEKAFSLAIDINDEDLFMDLHNCAKADGELEVAIDAYNKAEEILTQDDDDAELNEHEEDSTHSVCSHTSCSDCANGASCDASEDDESGDTSQMPTGNRPQAPSSSSSASSSARNQGAADDRPPLPLIRQQNAYVPPLPYFGAPALHTSDVRINIPKPELKVSAYSKNANHRVSTSNGGGKPMAKVSVAFPSVNFTPDNILLVDPPLPMLAKTGSHGNILQHSYPDFIHDITRTQLYHNSFSSENLDHCGGGGANKLQQSAAAVSLYQRTGKAPKALPRTAVPTPQMQPAAQQPQQHIVIDVVPKPNVAAGDNWTVPDQTLGIPLTFSHNLASSPTYAPRPVKPARVYNFTPPPNGGASESGYGLSANGNGGPASGPIIHQHPMALGNIPALANSGMGNGGETTTYVMTTKRPMGNRHLTTAKETSSILSSAQQPMGGPSSSSSSATNGDGSNGKRENSSGEKNKVKFSDTITVAVVPEIPRKDKSLLDRMKRPNGFHSLVTDPKKELADSLPLCHPNDEYLKDFTPMSSTTIEPTKKSTDENGSNRTKASTIKVVHFGVV